MQPSQKPLKRLTISQRIIRVLPGVELLPNIAIGNDGPRPLLIHLARPHRDRGRLPAVVYIYGGGWQHGNPDQGLWAIAALALRGYVAASIDYRLSHEATFPAQIADCKCSIRYLRAHAAEYRLDPDRIAAVGPSAGGNLAALLGTSAKARELEGQGGWAGERSDVQAVVDWSGPIDLLRMAEDQGNSFSSETWMARMIGGPLLEEREKVIAANPVTYISRTTPPFLIMHGDADDVVPFNQSQILDDALRAGGARSTFFRMPSRGHGFLGISAMRLTAAFLDRELKR
jgi:acetyl esterase/lipase